MRCAVCGAAIPPERLEILPETTTCVKCSKVTPHTEDTIPLDSTDPEELRRIVNA